MDEKVHPVSDCYKTNFEYPEWRWWYNVLAIAIIFALGDFIVTKMTTPQYGRRNADDGEHRIYWPLWWITLPGVILPIAVAIWLLLSAS